MSADPLRDALDEALEPGYNVWSLASALLDAAYGDGSVAEVDRLIAELAKRGWTLALAAPVEADAGLDPIETPLESCAGELVETRAKLATLQAAVFAYRDAWDGREATHDGTVLSDMYAVAEAALSHPSGSIDAERLADALFRTMDVRDDTGWLNPEAAAAIIIAEYARLTDEAAG